jgi:hypothetical protein
MLPNRATSQPPSQHVDVWQHHNKIHQLTHIVLSLSFTSRQSQLSGGLREIESSHRSIIAMIVTIIRNYFRLSIRGTERAWIVNPEGIDRE